MKRELALEFSRVTEAAALTAYRWLGKGDKNKADEAAVKAMRHMLNTININGKIVIGEGEIDEAPMLYIGEKVGQGGTKVDIAVDPIEGTRMVAMGQSNALATIMVAEEDSLFHAPDMYMEKLIVNSGAKGAIDLNKSIEENTVNIAKALNKRVDELTMITLAKPRHEKVIKAMQKMGVKVFAIPDGDVAGSILVLMPYSDVDFMYTIGGAPEGVMSAGVTRAFDGDMQARLKKRCCVKGDTPQNKKFEESEVNRCKEMGVDIEKIYNLHELVSTDNIIFSATGITKGDLVEGVFQKNDIAETETLLIRGKTRTVRRIKSTHFLQKKDKNIVELIFN